VKQLRGAVEETDWNVSVLDSRHIGDYTIEYSTLALLITPSIMVSSM